ncbi:LacI family DNA-binding transcriptional regulator [Bacillus massiliigorillae]|uniref:LacI family DNA-binding transcriptional regulator n=1 Tax=Bacillus massiliigorillae TaxID=1243664 RepID=UPI0003A62934|nr:LacI family DNA-binding transcriptional regulator [Bacillus massiliigorillae]
MVAKGNRNKPRIKDVAEKSGVSTATVSHVINGTRYVSDEVSEKVKAAMKELNYTPNPIARSLRSHQSYLVGLIIPVKNPADMANLFFMAIAQGIESILTKNGYKLILCNSYEDIEVEKEHIQMFNAQLVDGLILAPSGEDYRNLTEQYPVVFIDRKPKVYQGDCVLANNCQGAFEATEYLIKQGHKKIGFINGNGGLTTDRARLEGYQKALLKHGIIYDKNYVKEDCVSVEHGYSLTKELVEQKDVSAVFIANNILTMGAISYFQECHINIPDELAIIGFDDYEWTKIINPPLSCVRQPAFEIGQKAAEVLLERIANNDAPSGEYLLDTSLIVRKSC